MNTEKSHELFSRAKLLLPGGVNSPVRAFKSVGGEPFFAARAEGAYIIDVDGNRYIDYIGSWGPMIAGHAHPKVLQAVSDVMKNGLSFGVPNALEVTMAETITRLVPSCEMIRMVNSGTEATLSAIRLARGATGRNKIVKFEGCYHGHGDSFLVKAGSGMLTLGIPDSPGVPKELADLTLTLPFNDFDAAKKLFEEVGKDIAGLIVEPLAGTRVGVAYRSQIKHTLRGEVDFTGDDAGIADILRRSTGAFTDSDASLGLTTPASLSIGLHQDLTPKLALLAEAQWTDWSVFDQLTVKFDNPNQPDNVTEEEWHDTWFLALGTTYAATDVATDVATRAATGAAP